MPFGLSFAQLLDLSNQVPGLLTDIKKAEPKLSPLLAEAAALLESPELQATLTNIDAVLQNKALMVRLSKLITEVKGVAPTLAPIVKKAATLLHVVATTDNPQQASAKLARMAPDIAGSADRS